MYMQPYPECSRPCRLTTNIVLRSGAYNVILALEGDKWRVETFNSLGETLHPQISPEELQECEDIVRRDPRVQALAKEVGA